MLYQPTGPLPNLEEYREVQTNDPQRYCRRVVRRDEVFWYLSMLRGLWKVISGAAAEVQMGTHANNLVSTASTTHSPEQQETIHMIQMLRKEVAQELSPMFLMCVRNTVYLTVSRNEVLYLGTS